MVLLIVDDDDAYIEELEFKLEDSFTRIFTSTNLSEAKAVFDKSTPDVAIVDIRLSEEDINNKDGIELLRWIKEEGHKTKVIMFSRYKEFDYAVEALNAGAEYFLKKPIDHEELEQVIKKMTK